MRRATICLPHLFKQRSTKLNHKRATIFTRPALFFSLGRRVPRGFKEALRGSTSPSGGHQVDGLPPAPKTERESKKERAGGGKTETREQGTSERERATERYKKNERKEEK